MLFSIRSNCSPWASIMQTMNRYRTTTSRILQSCSRVCKRQIHPHVLQFTNFFSGVFRTFCYWQSLGISTLTCKIPSCFSSISAIRSITASGTSICISNGKRYFKWHRLYRAQSVNNGHTWRNWAGLGKLIISSAIPVSTNTSLSSTGTK